MTDRKAFVDPNETPEDVATLYSWANLHGAKYRDFSASRAQTRERARQRVQEAIEAERRRSHEDVEAPKRADFLKTADAGYQAENVGQFDRTATEEPLHAQRPSAMPAQGLPQRSRESTTSPYSVAPHPAADAPLQPPQMPAVPDLGQQIPHRATETRFTPYSQPAAAPAREEHALQNRNTWSSTEPRESVVRPAWLSAEKPEANAPAAPYAPEETLQGSRDRLTSRWFALKGVFSGSPVQSVETSSAPTSMRAPLLAVFSLAGGVGKTSLVATLGRALSARSERVLLVDTTSFGVLPFFFGARDQRPNVLRTFTPPGGSADSPIQLISMDPDGLGPENSAQEILSQEITRHSREVNRIIVDLATASASLTRRVLRMSPTVLVPVIPDMSSVVSVGSIDAFFHRNPSGAGQPTLPFYILNQFDPSLPLHLDVREVLREQLGDRLLPFALRRTPAVSEALAEGMTIVDYAPNSTAAEDFGALATWVKSLAAPATNSFRGVRWSEK